MRFLLVATWLLAGTIASAQDYQGRATIDAIKDNFPVQYRLSNEASRTFPRPIKVESNNGIAFTNIDMLPPGSSLLPDMDLYGRINFTFHEYSVSFGINTHYENKVDAFGTTKVYLEVTNESDRPISVDFGQLQIVKDKSSLALRGENGPVLAFVPGGAKVRHYFSLVNIRDQISKIPGPREIRRDQDLSLVESSLGPQNGFRIFFPFKPNEAGVTYFDAEVYAESYQIVTNDS